MIRLNGSMSRSSFHCTTARRNKYLRMWPRTPCKGRLEIRHLAARVQLHSRTHSDARTHARTHRSHLNQPVTCSRPRINLSPKCSRSPCSGNKDTQCFARVIVIASLRVFSQLSRSLLSTERSEFQHSILSARYSDRGATLTATEPPVTSVAFQ